MVTGDSHSNDYASLSAENSTLMCWILCILQTSLHRGVHLFPFLENLPGLRCLGGHHSAAGELG